MSQTDFERHGPRGRAGDRELILSVGEYAYTRDTTSGMVRVYTGPTVVNVTGQEHPVAWDTSIGRFVEVTLEEAARVSPVTPQGHYCVLYNPAQDASSYVHPEPGGKSVVKGELLIGQRINIAGPTNFALWPRQHAKVIKGHNLRSNQYLQVRIYDENAAKENWNSGVIKTVKTDENAPNAKSSAKKDDDAAATVDGPELHSSVLKQSSAPVDLTVGAQFIIKGTEVSFYIPPTGVEVVPFVDETGSESYVRDALTLERLEYCILIDEDGNKRFERGPQVVFPRPTESFNTQRGRGNTTSRIYRPIELNKIQGIYVKVIQEYTEGGRTYKEGEELFITGEDTPIYFPRVEHSLVKYDGNSKYFATAVPVGEARYVMDRTTGQVKMVRGPTMLLPDPRTEVVVRRVLNDKQCMNWYPKNEEVLSFNKGLRELASRAPTTRRGTVSEGEITRSKKMRTYASSAQGFSAASANGQVDTAGEEFSRGSTYTQPRTITLNTKFQGVPEINLFTGYAVMVVDKGGKRRVETGPKQILLAYDEDLEILKLSTGRPKNTDNLYFTPYLRVKNNKVADIVSVETRDHVKVDLKLSLRVDFTGDDPESWFQVENYVKFMCDHVRSVLKSRVRKLSIEDFYKSSEDIIRDTILGDKPKDGQRLGMFFKENDMNVSDVEVLSVTIPNRQIAQLLVDAQHHAVESSISLARDEDDLKTEKRREKLSQAKADAKHETRAKYAELEAESIARELELSIKRFDANLARKEKEKAEQIAEEAVTDITFEARLKRLRSEIEQTLKGDAEALAIQKERLESETAATVSRFKAAMEGGLSEALATLDNKDTLVKLGQALSIQRQIGGENLVDTIQNVLGSSEQISGLISAMTRGKKDSKK